MITSAADEQFECFRFDRFSSQRTLTVRTRAQAVQKSRLQLVKDFNEEGDIDLVTGFDLCCLLTANSASDCRVSRRNSTAE